jgi:antirestriction protein ArdC
MPNSANTLENTACESCVSVKDAYEKLQEVLMNINSNESWLQYLAFQARFYNYSFHNTLLIYSQNPSASYVAGYRKWQSFNRYVKKGERSLKIIAPVTYKSKEEEHEEDVKKLHGFRLVSVFDLSQTDGSDELLPVLVTGLHGSLASGDGLYSSILSIIDIPVTEVPQLVPKGCYYTDNPHIEIRHSLGGIQRIKTLLHELAHHIHYTKFFEGESYEVSEVIAESTAFIVCSVFGVDTTDYSASYIESWSGDTKDLEASAGKIQRISSEIISKIINTDDIDGGLLHLKKSV